MVSIILFFICFLFQDFYSVPAIFRGYSLKASGIGNWQEVLLYYIWSISLILISLLKSSIQNGLMIGKPKQNDLAK